MDTTGIKAVVISFQASRTDLANAMSQLDDELRDKLRELITNHWDRRDSMFATYEWIDTRDNDPPCVLIYYDSSVHTWEGLDDELLRLIHPKMFSTRPSIGFVWTKDPTKGSLELRLNLGRLI